MQPTSTARRLAFAPSEKSSWQLLARFARRQDFNRAPCPIVPNGVARNPSFPFPNLSRAVLVAPCAAGPLRATPASASLLRDLLTAVASSKRSLSFAFVILFARSSLPSNNLKRSNTKSRYLKRELHYSAIRCYEYENNMGKLNFFLE
jgi:hypothetical protein